MILKGDTLSLPTDKSGGFYTSIPSQLPRARELHHPLPYAPAVFFLGRLARTRATEKVAKEGRATAVHSQVGLGSPVDLDLAI